MAVQWHFAFHSSETPQILIDNAGFSFTTAGNTEQDITGTDPYTYSGDPTSKGSLRLRGNRIMTLPANAAASTGKGCIAAAIRLQELSTWQCSNPTRVLGVLSGAVNKYIYVSATSGQQTLALYVDNVFKESTPAYNWIDWKYVCLKYDMSTTTWSGRVYVDGVAATASQTDASTASTGVTLSIGSGGAPSNPGTSVNSMWIGQIATFDDNADSGETARYVTRVDPTVDGTNIGTWVPSTGVDDYAVVDSPLDGGSTNTAEASPTASDRVEVTPATLTTALGVTPSAVDSVCVHAFAKGSGTARAVIGDGTSETNGSTSGLNASTSTYMHVAAETKPSSGSWSGSDTPEMIFEVVTA
jgi:hypothetical protein